MPGRARLDAPGTLHHVIVRGIEKRKIVDDDQDRVAFIEKLGGLSIRTQSAIYAWVLMSNHAHLFLSIVNNVPYAAPKTGRRRTWPGSGCEAAYRAFQQ